MHNINVCLHTFYQSVRSVRLVSGSHIESISASLKLNGKYTATQWMPGWHPTESSWAVQVAREEEAFLNSDEVQADPPTSRHATLLHG